MLLIFLRNNLTINYYITTIEIQKKKHNIKQYKKWKLTTMSNIEMKTKNEDD